MTLRESVRKEREVNEIFAFYKLSKVRKSYGPLGRDWVTGKTTCRRRLGVPDLHQYHQRREPNFNKPNMWKIRNIAAISLLYLHRTLVNVVVTVKISELGP